MMVSNDLKPATDLSQEFIDKVRDNIKNYAPQREVDPKKVEVLQQNIKPVIPSVKLSKEEANFLQSWRLEEYVSIMDRMKSSDPEQYKAHQKALMDAQDSGGFGADIKVRLSAYRWAYGDGLDKIYKENPEVDVFIQSPQDNPALYKDDYRNEYQKKQGNPYVVVTTKELNLLMSKRIEDKTEQEKLMLAIQKRIQKG